MEFSDITKSIVNALVDLINDIKAQKAKGATEAQLARRSIINAKARKIFV